MEIVVDSGIKKRFLESFKDLNQNDFYGRVEFADDQVGFSVKKKYRDDRHEISLIKIALFKGRGEVYEIYINVTFGLLKGDSVNIRNRDQMNFKDPIDIQSTDYFFDVSRNYIFKGSKIIAGNDLLSEIYSKHVKSTKKFGGLVLRIKLWFWKIFLKKTVELISKSITIILQTISGIRYEYDAFFSEEKIDQLWQNRGKNEILKEPRTIEFIGYKASQWTIIFYCSVHLLLFFVFYFYHIYPKWAILILKSNFLIGVYAILSLWLFEIVLPRVCKYCIKYLSTLSLEIGFKKINI